MALHLIKLCVGCDSVDDLRAWQEAEAARGRPPMCRTRQSPKRGAECAEGGSLYWVIKGVVLCRQAIVDVRTLGEGRAGRCEIDLSPELVATLPQPRRAFQGWRYLDPKDAPADLSASNDGETPLALALQLREIGAW